MRVTSSAVTLGLTAAALHGCGSDSSTKTATPPATPIAGAVAGHSFSSQDAMGQVITITSGSSIRNEVTVVATAWANACGHASQGELPANAGMLVIDVVSTGPLAGGTYPIAGNGLVKVFFRTVDMTCTETTRVVAQSGTVTYTKADLSSIAGSVDAVFPGGDHLTGQFVAPLCNALGASPSTCP